MSIEDLQAEASAAMNMVFDYFKRSNPVTFYRDATETLVAADPNWNSDFGAFASPNAVITRESESAQFDCRIIFTKEPSMIKNVDGDENIGLKTQINVGEVKIQVKADGFEWLKSAKSFLIEGERFSSISDWRGVGIMGNYETYELTLKKDK